MPADSRVGDARRAELCRACCLRARLVSSKARHAGVPPQVLHCRELGMNAMVVMEQYSELDLLLAAARRLGVRPSIGIRAKLTTRHNGHWGSTSGDKAKVGGAGLLLARA